MQVVSNSVTTGSDVRCLGVHIDGGDPVLVPLLTELPRRRFRELTRALNAARTGEMDVMDAEDIIASFFAEHLGADTVDAMNEREYLAMIRAWSTASEEEAGASLGE